MPRPRSRAVVFLITVAAILSLSQTGNAQTFVVSAHSWDTLKEDYLYLARLFGNEPGARKQLDELIRSYAGGKGLAWLDTRKPFGGYAEMPEKVGKKPAFVFLLPIADEKAFLDALSAASGQKVEKGANDLYLVQSGPDWKFYLRLSSKHAYLSTEPTAVRGPLRDPATLALGTRPSCPLAASFRIDRIPKVYKDAAIAGLTLATSVDSTARTGETKAEFKARQDRIERAIAELSRLFEEAREITLRLEIDREGKQLALEAALLARENTRLARQIKNLGAEGTMFGNLDKDSVASLGMRLLVPEEWQNDWSQLILGAFELEVSKVLNLKDKVQGRRILRSLEPTVKAGYLDFGMALQGPHTDGACTLIVGLKVVDGSRFEQQFREFLRDQPADFRANNIRDFARHGNTRIHKLKPDKEINQGELRLLGDAGSYVAIRPDVLLATQGKHALPTIKAFLDYAGKGAVSEAMRLDCSLIRLLTVFANQYETPTSRENINAVRKVLAGADKDRDRITLRLLGGESLRLRLTLDNENVRTLGTIYNRMEEKNRKPPAK